MTQPDMSHQQSYSWDDEDEDVLERTRGNVEGVPLSGLPMNMKRQRKKEKPWPEYTPNIQSFPISFQPLAKAKQVCQPPCRTLSSLIFCSLLPSNSHLHACRISHPACVYIFGSGTLLCQVW